MKSQPLEIQHLHNIHDKLSKLIPQLQQDDYWDFRDYPDYCAKLLKDLSRLAKQLTQIEQKEITRAELIANINIQMEQGADEAALESLLRQLEPYDERQEKFAKDKLRRSFGETQLTHLVTLTTIIQECEKAGTICQSENEFSGMIKAIIAIENAGEFAMEKENRKLILALTKAIDPQAVQPEEFWELEIEHAPVAAPLIILGDDSEQLVEYNFEDPQNAARAGLAGPDDRHKSQRLDQKKPLPARLQEIVQFYCGPQPESSDLVEIINSISDWQDKDNIQLIHDVTQNNFICASDKINREHPNFLNLLSQNLNSNHDFVEAYYELTDSILSNFFGITIDNDHDDEDGMTQLSFDKSQPQNNNKNWMIAGSLEHTILQRIAQNAQVFGFTNYAAQLHDIMARNVQQDHQPSSRPHPESSEHPSKRTRLDEER